jgi:uncharacterized repeat protein (TIGR01451 family)
MRADVMAGLTNRATVTGTVSEGVDVSATEIATVTIISPSVELVKEAEPAVVNVGDTVMYTITVENTGDSDLSEVVVDDSVRAGGGRAGGRGKREVHVRGGGSGGGGMACRGRPPAYFISPVAA